MPKSGTEPWKTKAHSKDGFSRVIKPNPRRPILDALDTLFPKTREKTVLTTSQSGTSGTGSPLLRVFNPPGRGRRTAEIEFSDDNTKESVATRGPSTLEIIDNIRSPSPDFGFDDMDDLIRAAPDSALDADKFAGAIDLVVDDAEDVSSPFDAPQAPPKHSRDLSPSPDPPAKRMKRVSDWEEDIHRRRFQPVRSESVQEVGASLADIAPGCLLTSAL